MSHMSSDVASQNSGGGEYLVLGEEQYLCLGRRFSKHKMARYAKNLGEAMPPGNAMHMPPSPRSRGSFFVDLMVQCRPASQVPCFCEALFANYRTYYPFIPCLSVSLEAIVFSSVLCLLSLRYDYCLFNETSLLSCNRVYDVINLHITAERVDHWTLTRGSDGFSSGEHGVCIETNRVKPGFHGQWLNFVMFVRKTRLLKKILGKASYLKNAAMSSVVSMTTAFGEALL